MSLNNFIPTVWAGSILRNLNKIQVYAQAGVVNRDYEGEIKEGGNTVKINNIGPVTIGNYTKDTNISDPEALTSSQTTLTIDQQKYFNFAIDDIDKAQGNPRVMNEGTYEAGYGLADTGDRFVAGLYLGVDAGNTIGDDTTPVVPTPDDAYDHLVDLATKLDEANVARMGRWVILPPWYHGMMQKDDRFIGFNTATGRAALESGMLGTDRAMNGQVGTAAGFAVLTSNNTPNVAGTKYKIMGGYPGAISFADSIVEVEGYRPEKRFGDALKGLHVYGAKLVRATGVALLTANKA